MDANTKSLPTLRQRKHLGIFKYELMEFLAISQNFTSFHYQMCGDHLQDKLFLEITNRYLRQKPEAGF